MVSKKKYDVVTTFRNYDLHGAAAAGNIGLVMYALKNGQPINAVLGGLLPIHAAASGGSVDVVQLLIDEGADVNIPRLPSSTGPPIGVGGAGNMVGPNGIVGDHHHVQSGAGGEKLHKGRLGSSAGSSQPSTAASARPESARAGQALPIGRRGSTPLHFAAAQGNIGVARLLLENGANLSAVDCDKATPEAVARAAGQWKIIEIFREWQVNEHNGPRRSAETARGVGSSSNGGLRPGDVAPDFKFGNVSTSSLPLTTTHPAANSTSSLGRYPSPGRRPSLPSIYESPPSTSYARTPHKQKTTGDRPATASSAQGSTSSPPKESAPARRPNTAGANRELQMYSSTDDAPSKGSLTSARNHAASSVHSAASKLNRIFKRTNMRPATASGALSTPDTLSPAPPTGTRSRSPSTSKASDHKDRGGGFFNHQGPHHHQGLRHPVSREAISGPITDGQSAYAPIVDRARPAMVDARMASNSSAGADLSTSPDEFGDDESTITKALNLTQAELEYAKSRGLMQDRMKNARTAPASQTSFGNKPPGPTIKSYHSHSTLNNKTSASTLPRMVPRHRANLGPGGGLALNTADTGPQEDGIPTRGRLDVVSPVPSDRLSPAGHVARPAASFSSLNRSTDALKGLSRNASVSSLDTSLTSKSNTTDSNEAVRSPDAGEESGTDYVSRQVRTRPSGSNLSPYSASAAGGVSPVSTTSGYYFEQSPTSPGSAPFMHGKMVSNRQQALELIEAQKRAIQDDMEQKVKARRLASATSHRTMDSPLSATTTGVPETPLTPIGHNTTEEGPMEEEEEVSMGQEDITSLRERLEQLGESVQIERRFAKGELQARRWNRESGLEEGNYDENLGDVERIGATPMVNSVLTRSEMLDGYLRKGETSESEKVRRPPTPKRDVFGRPVTPKQGRPPTPKENRPTTPKNTLPSSSRTHDAPRENRILPPPQKTSSRQHLGLEQSRGISKSDFALNSYINKDDLLGRERAWTTTEVRPRVGPAPPTRPSTATTGREPPRQNNNNLTIDIIQTAPTPTDAPTTPLKGNPSVGATGPGDRGESLRHRRRCSSTPLTIDAKMAQEKVNEEIPDRSPLPSDKQSRQRSASRTRKPPTPTGSKGDQPVLLHRITTTTPPSPLPINGTVTSSEGPFTSNTSFSSHGHASTENVLPTTPVPHLPSAVDLHNMHVSRAREEAMRGMEIPQIRHSPQLESPDPMASWRSSPPAAAERRLGLGTSNNAQFGYESVRSFNEEKGDKQWRLLGVESRGSDSPGPIQQQKSPQKKFGGLFSRLKR